MQLAGILHLPQNGKVVFNSIIIIIIIIIIYFILYSATSNYNLFAAFTACRFKPGVSICSHCHLKNPPDINADDCMILFILCSISVTPILFLYMSPYAAYLSAGEISFLSLMSPWDMLPACRSDVSSDSAGVVSPTFEPSYMCHFREYVVSYAHDIQG